MKSNYLKIGIGIVVFVGIALGYYFLYYTKTPTYSLGIIQESVKQHNLEQFKKHVDVDQVTSSAVRDIVEVELNYDKTIAGNVFARAIIENLKPALDRMAANKLLDAVSGKAVANNASENNDGNVIDKSGIDSLKFRKISSEAVDGNSATLGVLVTEPSLDKDFMLLINMSKLDDGTWKVVRVDKLGELLSVIKEVQATKTKKYIADTQSIVDKYNQKYKALGDEYGDVSKSDYAKGMEIWSKVKELTQERKIELETVPVPDVPQAKEIFNLRNASSDKQIEICDVAMQSCKNGVIYDQDSSTKYNDFVNDRREIENKLKTLLDNYR